MVGYFVLIPSSDGSAEIVGFEHPRNYGTAGWSEGRAKALYGGNSQPPNAGFKRLKDATAYAATQRDSKIGRNKGSSELSSEIVWQSSKIA